MFFFLPWEVHTHLQRRLEKQWWDFGLNPLSLRSQITQSVPSRNQYKTFQRFTFLGHGSRTLPGKTAASLFLSFTVSVFFFPSSRVVLQFIHCSNEPLIFICFCRYLTPLLIAQSVCPLAVTVAKQANTQTRTHTRCSGVCIIMSKAAWSAGFMILEKPVISMDAINVKPGLDGRRWLWI